MASIVKDANGRKRILFFDRDGERKAIRLGKATMQQAATVKLRIELLVAAKINGTAPDDDTSRWVASIGDDLHAKLAGHDLVVPRVRVSVPTLGAFIDGYIAGRTDVKRGTIIWYQQTRRCLVDYFGADRLLDEFTAGEANDFRRWLTCPKNRDNPMDGGQGLGENTARKRCAIAKQMFADAVDRELMDRNPFGKMEGLTVGASNGRDYFVSREEAAKVLAACPDSQWRLLFALSRYGGLRCPSEHLGLCWGDVDWERGRITVRSPKTEHHAGKAERIIPLFPELRPYLQVVLDELLADFDPKENRLSVQPVISRYRGTNANLRTQFCRIIRKAGLTPWPKLFQNLRSTRATELAAEFPAHVAAEWMGHSTVVADKHYWRVTDADFDRAAQNRAHNAVQLVGTDRQASEQKSEKPGDYENHRVPAIDLVLPVGLEPTTY
jgi:integrase